MMWARVQTKNDLTMQTLSIVWKQTTKRIFFFFLIWRWAQEAPFKEQKVSAACSLLVTVLEQMQFKALSKHQGARLLEFLLKHVEFVPMSL